MVLCSGPRPLLAWVAGVAATLRCVCRFDTDPFGAIAAELQAWMNETLTQVSAKSPLALAMGYALSNWTALVRFFGDGRIEAENNAAERALRAVAIGRKNFLHLGSDAGGESAAVIYTLIGTAKLNGINPQHYLHYVLERINEHKVNHIDELLPWAVAERIAPDTQQVQTAQELPLAA
jgi:transposase